MRNTFFLLKDFFMYHPFISNPIYIIMKCSTNLYAGSLSPCFDNGECSHTCVVRGKEKECLCPKNMKLLNNTRCVVSSSNCTAPFFACDNGECKDPSFICDGDSDCSDKSDESEILCRTLLSFLFFRHLMSFLEISTSIRYLS